MRVILQKAKKERNPRKGDVWQDWRTGRMVDVLLLRRGGIIYKNRESGRHGSTSLDRFKRLFVRMDRVYFLPKRKA